MPKDAILRTFSQAKEIGVRSIAIIGEGENTLNPHFHDALEHGREIDLDLGLATNGVRIDPQRAELLLTALTWLRINISAATPEAFKRIHNTDHYHRVLDNVRALVKAKAENGYPCTLGLQMVVTSDNFDQIVPLAKLGCELGVDYLVIKPCSDTPEGDLGSPHDEYAKQTAIYEEAMTWATDSYEVVPKMAKLMDHGWKDYPVCFGTQFIIAISGNGNTFPCGHWFDIRTDEFLMGNVIDTSFADIVSSERYWQVQKHVQSVDVNHECETNCRQHYANQFLSKLSNPPNHLNFV